MRITSLAAVVSQKTTHCALLHLSVRRHDSAYCTRRPCTRISCVGEGYCTRAGKKFHYHVTYSGMCVLYTCARDLCSTRGVALVQLALLPTSLLLCIYIRYIVFVWQLSLFDRFSIRFVYGFLLSFFFFFYLDHCPLPRTRQTHVAHHIGIYCTHLVAYAALCLACKKKKKVAHIGVLSCHPIAECPRSRTVKEKKTMVRTRYRTRRSFYYRAPYYILFADQSEIPRVNDLPIIYWRRYTYLSVHIDVRTHKRAYARGKAARKY